MQGLTRIPLNLAQEVKKKCLANGVYWVLGVEMAGCSRMRKQSGRKQGGDRRCSSELRSQGCLVCLGHTEVGSLTSYMKTFSRTQALLVLVAVPPQHLVWCSADHQCSRNACSHNPKHGGGGARARWQAEIALCRGYVWALVS